MTSRTVTPDNRSVTTVDAPPSSSAPARAGRLPHALVVASVLGAIHAGFSLYWAGGGTFLVASLGTDLVEQFQGRQWLLAPVGVVKLLAALGPLALARSAWPARRVSRLVCWLGALLLIVWGGLNTVVAHVVLTGVITTDSGFDRPGMVGHAYLWDPLFLAWGVAVAIGLWVSRTPPAPALGRTAITR